MTSLRFGVRLTLSDIETVLPNPGPQVGLSIRYRTQRKVFALWIGLRMTERAGLANLGPNPTNAQGLQPGEVPPI